MSHYAASNDITIKFLKQQIHRKMFHVRGAEKFIGGPSSMLSRKTLKAQVSEMLFPEFSGRNLVNLQNSEGNKMPYKILIFRVRLVWDQILRGVSSPFLAFWWCQPFPHPHPPASYSHKQISLTPAILIARLSNMADIDFSKSQ